MVEATLPALYSADEVIMVARQPLPSNSTPHADARASAAYQQSSARAGEAWTLDDCQLAA
jgi:hypothetical protein